MSLKVASVVVTFNRKELLVKTLESLFNQSKKIDEIIIIDNASNDGTREFLEGRGYVQNNLVTYIELSENSGGAGGFYTGIKKAYEKGYDWIWVMDDDGIPHQTCLEELLMNKEKSEFLAPLVLNITDHEELAFNYKGNNSVKEIFEQFGGKNVIANFACPFNGILLKSELIKKIGYPKKDMFIWGDEQEYYRRALKCGVTPVTILSAVHYHPKDRIKYSETILGKKILFPDGKLRQYCVFRNHTYINKKYYGVMGLVKRLCLYTYFFIFTRRFDLKGLAFFYMAYFDGLFENFDRHKKYV